MKSHEKPAACAAEGRKLSSTVSCEKILQLAGKLQEYKRKTSVQ